MDEARNLGAFTAAEDTDVGFVILAKATPTVCEIDQLRKLTVRRRTIELLYFGIVVLVVYAFAHFLPQLTNAKPDPAPQATPLGPIPPVTSGWFWFGMACIFVVIGCVIFWGMSSARKKRAAYAKMMEPFGLLFTGQRVELRNDLSSLELQWAAFTKYKADPNGVSVLFINQAPAVWWSKAWFTSIGDYDRVMDHVRTLNLAQRTGGNTRNNGQAHPQ